MPVSQAVLSFFSHTHIFCLVCHGRRVFNFKQGRLLIGEELSVDVEEVRAFAELQGGLKRDDAPGDNV